MTTVLEIRSQITDEQEHINDDEQPIPIRQWSPFTAKVVTKPNINPAIRERALKHIAENVLYDANLRKVYLFPSEDQMRMLLVEADNPPILEGDEIAPYYFSAHPELASPFVTGIAIIRPEEAEKLPPPYCWSDWSEAEILWEEESKDAA